MLASGVRVVRKNCAEFFLSQVTWHEVLPHWDPREDAKHPKFSWAPPEEAHAPCLSGCPSHSWLVQASLRAACLLGLWSPILPSALED